MKIRSLFVVLAALALAASATAQTKASGTLQCAKSDPMNSIEVGDRPGHMYVLEKQACTWTKPMDVGGMQAKEGVSVQTNEVNAGKSNGGGSHTGTVEGGDKYMVRFTGHATMDKSGVPTSITGTWSYTGGTGKLKGISGKGTYKNSGAPNADGSQSFEVEGEYTLPAKK